MGAKRPYIVHPDRLKLSETSFHSFPLDIKLIIPAKRVSFSPNIIEFADYLPPEKVKNVSFML